MTILKTASYVACAAFVVAGCERADPAPGATEPAASAVVDGQKPAASADGADDGREGSAQAAANLAFQNRLEKYLAIHKEAESKVPNLRETDDPQKIADREAALAKAIMTLRAGAQPGEIFAAEYQPYLIKIVQDDFSRREAVDRKALVAELPPDMKVNVNTVYPTTLPLATFPAALLRKLPDLPPELEYRLVGRSLILRDVKANLIVDVIRGVVPTIPS
jgi:hypothetical protein